MTTYAKLYKTAIFLTANWLVKQFHVSGKKNVWRMEI